MALIHRIMVAPGDGAVRAMAQARAIAGRRGAGLAAAGEGDAPGAAATWAAGADLLVASLPRAPQSRRWHPGPADWELLRHSPCPVLMTQGHERAAYREVLVAVDPMHSHDKPAALDDRLIALARELADEAARITLLHCHLAAEYVPFRAPGAAHAGVLHRSTNSTDAHQRALADLATRHGIPPGAVRLEAGDAREAIAEAAGQGGVDLVVLGAISRSRIGRLLIGSTTESVIGRLGCDVLAVPPPAA